MLEPLLVPGWHPLVVHFPLALIITSVLLLTLARLLRQETWARTLATVGTWNLCLGAIAVLFALATGLAATLDLNVPEAVHRAIGAHVKSAILAALMVLLLAVWRGAGSAHDSRPTWLFLLLLWAAGAVVIVTGLRGARNVYEYGVGVRTASSHTTNAAAAPDDERRADRSCDARCAS